MKKKLLLTVVAFGLIAVLWAAIPYLLPTRIALGPCGRDWTSPSSWIPRASPTRSENWSIGQTQGKICYGSPSARGRTVFGQLVSWGELWRAGANEPTRIFVDGSIDLAGIPLEAGRYSIYMLPEPERWEIFVSDSTFHWGNAISSSVRLREVGSSEVPVSSTDRHVEQLTFRWEPVDEQHGSLVLEWESSRVEIPLASREG